MKTVKGHINKLEDLVQSIMAESFYNCKHHDKEVCQFASSVNTKAHQCSKLLERLLAEYKREKSASNN